jgi:hypothetical protein
VAAAHRHIVTASILCWLAAWSSAAHADWAACQHKPTRACLLEEALRGDNGPLTGKDRLDVLALTGYRDHPEFLTPADIDEATRQVTSQPPLPLSPRIVYAALAIKGLVATKRFQEASDLAAHLESPIHLSALHELTRDLIKAGEWEKAPIFASQMSAVTDPEGLVGEAVRDFTEMGKIEEALAVMALNLSSSAATTSDMLEAVGFAYAKRGDPQLAARFYDRAQVILEWSRRPVDDGSAMEFYFGQMSLKAYRGDIEGVRTALTQPPPTFSTTPAASLESYRLQGSQKLLLALLQTDHGDVAAEVARSMPERFRPFSLASVARHDVEKARLDDARAILSSLGDRADPKLRGTIIHALAVATAKSGNIVAAVAQASQTDEPMTRRAILFDVAQTLP